MQQLEFEAKNISIKEASRILGKSEQFIRQGLIDGVLPIGIAFKRKGSSHYSYYINSKKLFDFTGYRYQHDSGSVSYE